MIPHKCHIAQYAMNSTKEKKKKEKKIQPTSQAIENSECQNSPKLSLIWL